MEDWAKMGYQKTIDDNFFKTCFLGYKNAFISFSTQIPLIQQWNDINIIKCFPRVQECI